MTNQSTNKTTFNKTFDKSFDKPLNKPSNEPKIKEPTEQQIKNWIPLLSIASLLNPDTIPTFPPAFIKSESLNFSFP